MKKFFQKFIGDKAFYKMVLAVAIPIMIQNGITNFVSLLDNIMVGTLGTEQISGVGISNQLIFVFNLGIFGAVSGVGIFTAQFFGNNDEKGVAQSFRAKVVLALVISAVAIAIFSIFDTQLISLYLNDGSQTGNLQQTLSFAKSYLAVMLIGLPAFALSQAYSSTLRETGHTVMPMVSGFCAVGVNALFNYLLIFGKFGFPALGVTGAAIASVISRYVELVVLIVTSCVTKQHFATHLFADNFSVPSSLIGDIVKRGTPLFINELLWGAGMSFLAQCYSVRGLDAVTGYHISSTVINVFNIAYIALGNSVGIIIGKYLGAGDYDKALDEDKKLIAFCIAVGTAMALVMACFAKPLTSFYNTTDQAKDIATKMMLICACCMPFQSFLHSCYFTLRSGGRTIITFIYDSGFVWAVSVPLVYCLAHFTNVSIFVLYSAGLGIELLKCVVGYVMLKNKIWLNKIV